MERKKSTDLDLYQDSHSKDGRGAERRIVRMPRFAHRPELGLASDLCTIDQIDFNQGRRWHELPHLFFRISVEQITGRRGFA